MALVFKINVGLFLKEKYVWMIMFTLYYAWFAKKQKRNLCTGGHA